MAFYQLLSNSISILSSSLTKRLCIRSLPRRFVSDANQFLRNHVGSLLLPRLTCGALVSGLWSLVVESRRRVIVLVAVRDEGILLLRTLSLPHPSHGRRVGQVRIAGWQSGANFHPLP